MAAPTPADFRAAFPEFTDPVKYPDTAINFWFSLGQRLMDPFRWGDVAYYGLFLFAAHNLALGQMSVAASSQGIPGLVVGALTSASVDKVSYSRASVMMDPKNGQWNLTTYGMRWVTMVRMIGAGPVQVGAPGGPGGWWATNEGYSGAWPGVIYPPAFQ